MSTASRINVKSLTGCCAVVALLGLGSVSSSAWQKGATPAAEPIAFNLPGEDGYGIADCMQPGNACGQVMANSWCEAHGHTKAVAFGAADLTGSTPQAEPTQAATTGVMIRCGD